MIYSVDFLGLSEKVNPFAFIKYLKDTGWKVFPTKREDVGVLQLEERGRLYQVAIPKAKIFQDYQEAMYRAITTVAEAEAKPIEQLMLYLLNPNADILKIRLDRKEIEAGSILFDDAIRLYENTKKLLAATALDILHPKKYHQGRIDDVISSFLTSCRYGQTEIGSYVVSVVCPLSELDANNEFRQLSIFSEEEENETSLTRKVTSRLMSNITKIKKSIDDGEISCLSSYSTDIISANFYEALIGLNLSAEDTLVEFSTEWASGIKPPYGIPGRIVLTHDYCSPIQTVINRLKEHPENSKKIFGKIRRLESSPDLQTRTTGKVTITYLDDAEKCKSVVVELDKSDYDKAIEAHGKGAYVKILGEFHQNNKKLMKCNSFEIID